MGIVGMKNSFEAVFAIGYGLLPVGLTYHLVKALELKRKHGILWSR
jgi:hypothetical protein